MKITCLSYNDQGFNNRQMYEFPNIINIEVFRGKCSCKCVHCPVGITPKDQRRIRFGRKGMDLSLFRKIINEVSIHPHSTLRIHSVGEPLLWDDLDEALNILSNRKVRTWLFTCAITKNLKLLEAICSNINIIEISLNSTSRNGYKNSKGVDKFYHVLSNIKYMYNFIQLKKIKTRMIVSRVESFDRKADYEFVKKWKSSGFVDDAFIRSYHSYNDILKTNKNDILNYKKEPCLVHWKRMNIGVNGDVVVCFNELFNKNISQNLVLGNISEQTIESVWKGIKLQMIRIAELQGDYSGDKFTNGLPCKKCQYFQSTQTFKHTSEFQVKQWRLINAKNISGKS